MILANNLLKKGQQDEALKWMLAGAKKGDALFQANYGRNLFSLKGPSAAPEAVEWLRKAARRHQPVACYSLALILYQGTGVPRTTRKPLSGRMSGARRATRIARRCSKRCSCSRMGPLSRKVKSARKPCCPVRNGVGAGGALGGPCKCQSSLLHLRGVLVGVGHVAQAAH